MFRNKEKMIAILKRAGFCDVRIYDDANYSDLAETPDNILKGVDVIPSIAH